MTFHLRTVFAGHASKAFQHGASPYINLDICCSYACMTISSTLACNADHDQVLFVAPVLLLP